MSINRRAVVWSAPVIVAVGVAPAIATSPVPELAGLMKVTYAPSWISPSSLTMTTQGAGLGLRMEGSVARPESATLTIYYSSNVVPSGTSWAGSGGGWTAPKYVRTEGSYTVWEVRYRGTWTQTSSTTWTASAFTWRANVNYASGLKSRVIRTAVVSGNTYSKDSGYVTIGAAYATRSAQPPSSDGGGDPSPISKSL